MTRIDMEDSMGREDKKADGRCESCMHCSLDGRWCHNWGAPTELRMGCRCHTPMSGMQAWICGDVKMETKSKGNSKRRHGITNTTK